jgi:putative photosynthetic complex assembly protein
MGETTMSEAVFDPTDPRRRYAATRFVFRRNVACAVAGVLTIVTVVGLLARSPLAATQVPRSTPVAERSLLFADGPDHSVIVRDAATARIIAVVTGPAGFLRPTLRGLAQQRRRDDLSRTTPFRLTLWADGRLTLDDPPTRRHLELEAFGPTNEAVFGHFLTASEGTN